MKTSPYFLTLKRDQLFEVRQYHPCLMAKVEIQDTFENAFKKGSKLLSEYAFGNNYKKQKLQLASPILLSSRATGWEVSCFLPQGIVYTELPRPLGEEVKLMEVIERKVAVIKFHGKSPYSSIMKKTEELKCWARDSGLPVSKGSKIVLYQSAILPFMRRNEIHFDAQ